MSTHRSRVFRPPPVAVIEVSYHHGADTYGIRIRWGWASTFNDALFQKALDLAWAEHAEANARLFKETGGYQFRAVGAEWPVQAELRRHVAAALAGDLLAEFYATGPTMSKLSSGPRIKAPVPQAGCPEEVVVLDVGPSGGTAEVMAHTETGRLLRCPRRNAPATLVLMPGGGHILRPPPAPQYTPPADSRAGQPPEAFPGPLPEPPLDPFA